MQSAEDGRQNENNDDGDDDYHRISYSSMQYYIIIRSFCFMRRQVPDSDTSAVA